MGVSFFSKTAWMSGGQQLLNTFLSTSCPICERPTSEAICPNCQRQLYQYRLSSPLQQPLPGLPVVAWASYEGSVRQVIARLKYDHQPAIAQQLGTELGQVWRQVHSTGAKPVHRSPLPVVIPIPLHPQKQQQRGFNQAELIAVWFSRVTGLSMLPDGLCRIQATTPQHGLSRRDRFCNLAQAFTLNPKHQARLRHSPVWLIDDIFTTGATAQAAAQTLRRHQISVAGMGAVAMTLSETQRQGSTLHQ